MKKDRVIKLCVVALCLALITIGGTIAYFRAETSTQNKMTSTALKIALNNGESDSGFEISEDRATYLNASPGDVLKRQMYVQNVETSPMYVRLTITKYWKDEQGNKVSDLDASYIKIKTEQTDHWIIQDDDRNNEVIYMYYRLPLETNEYTDDALSNLVIGDINMTNEYASYQVQIDVEADGIQKYAAKQAILAEWGLDVEIDDQGILQSVEE